TGAGAARIAQMVQAAPLAITAAAAPPAGLDAAHKPRVGLYRSWSPNSDEGWTRWILQNYGFAPITLRNGDIQASDLIQRFDAIILPDAGPGQILNGFAPGTLPGEYVGGVGKQGTEALRQFVEHGGTLITFNNASLYAIEQFGLEVTNVLDKLKPDQFYCSGSLLRVVLPPPAKGADELPGQWGLGPDATVMFENGPAFEPKKAFRGAVLASYPEGVNPLASGYLLHPERIEGKAAALVAAYGQGRIYLFGFKPQWRAQSHGTYKFLFNAIYDSPARSGASTYPAPPPAKN
ncbi:MAG: hypothetical protein ACRD1E_12080, partial [Terriglobales bacterium]